MAKKTQQTQVRIILNNTDFNFEIEVSIYGSDRNSLFESNSRNITCISLKSISASDSDL